MKKTLGEKRMRMFELPEGEEESPAIMKIKTPTAALIDHLNSIRNDEVSKTYENSSEVMREVSGEKLRLISLAQTAYEEAAMWAVKAVTYKE